VVRAFRWWAELRGLDAEVADRIPHGRTSTDAAAVLAPHLDSIVEGAVLDERQRVDTDGVVALPGAREALHHAPLAIVTSCPLPLAEARLDAAGLPTPAILVTPEQWTHGKPHPEPYLVGARRVDVAPERCLVLEDAPAGVAAGCAAGMRVFAVLTTHTEPELPGATAYLQDLTHLAEALAAHGLPGDQ
jgi:mannitol-1-/sugar-/sorbitol-6-phosphatase